MFSRLILGSIAALFVLILAGVGLAGYAVMSTYPKLPSLEVLTDYRPKIPLRVFTADGIQIGEFGEERRAFTRIKDTPQLMKQAILAAEDERFYQHGGVDYMGVLRAMSGNLLSGQTKSGASTITMQVAKNFFLSSERTFTRKFNEALLSFKIESNLSKDQILELYFNQIYLGQRAYGFAAAAQIYYGKPLADLTIAEMAMLAGLPKAPSLYNPVVNPDRAHLRQLYVLRRMRELNFITQEQFDTAKDAPMTAVRRQMEDFSVPAQYVAEMVRQTMFERYAEAAYTEGFSVTTTVDSQHQKWAFEALRAGLTEYDVRHGYRAPEAYIDLKTLPTGEQDETLDEALAPIRDSGRLHPGVVLETTANRVLVYLRGGQRVEVKGAGLNFARRALSSKLTPAQQIRPGAVVRVFPNASNQWEIGQMPQVEGAFVSLDPNTGAIKSLVGGFDFNRNHFNRVTMAWRQPGSSFKPFIYSAGLERGFTTATTINDAPLVIDPQSIGGQRWEPKNYDGKFAGMMTMRQALIRSKNLVSIRILMAIGTDYAQQYIQRFGFGAKQHPAYLTMALGAGVVTPLQMAEGYSVFANGGWRVRSYLIDYIKDSKGNVIAKTTPTVAGEASTQQTLDPRNAFITTSMMKDVVRFGTAVRAMSLGRMDLAGKTGTTNDSRDAWFSGFNPSLVGIAWVGFDNNRSLGGGETGGGAALPIWMGYMANALKGVPEVDQPVPKGMVEKAGQGSKGQPEYFYEEFLQTNPELGLNNRSSGGGGGGNAETEGEGGDTPARPSTAPAATTPKSSGKAARDAVESVKEQLF